MDDDARRRLAEGVAERRAAAFARLRRNERFCAYIKRVAAAHGRGDRGETD